MDRNKKGSGGIYLGAILSLCLLGQSPAFASSASASWDSSPSVAVSDVFTIDLVGDTTDTNGGLLGGGLEFTFDQTIVNVVSVVVADPPWDCPDLCRDSDNPNNPAPDNTQIFSIDNIGGSVSGISFSQFAGVSGSDTAYATVTFQAVGVGITSLVLTEFGNNPFNDIDGAVDVLTLTNGSIQVVPVPAAAWLFASGLLGLLGVRRRLQVN